MRSFFCAAPLLLVFAAFGYAQSTPVQYQPLTLDFEIESTSETASVNPFLDYRLNVTFAQGDATYLVPGYYAADGNAAETSAHEGGTWRVHFTPPAPGAWTYSVSFRSGSAIAVQYDAYIGARVMPHDGTSGTLNVATMPASATGFDRRGWTMHGGTHYVHTHNGEPMLLVGTNSPENLLAYADFDGTYQGNPDKNYIKTWAPHVQDWQPGDPSWQGGKGKGLIGALNYLASKRMNVVYAMALTLHGDAEDVWPFISHRKQDYTRYDVSKLAQWGIVFEHAERLGIVMELVTQEQENQLILDDGYTTHERRLYYRELIARFGHLKNIIWNIGEENGEHDHYWPQGQNDQQRYAMIRYLKDNDPYQHPVLMHTFAVPFEREPILKRLLRFDRFDGPSMQIYNAKTVHEDIKRWIDASAEYTRPWIVMMDELGPWHTGTRPDIEDAAHDTLRKDVLWGALMAGGAGVQWYFGWLTPPHDLNAEDWRSRNNMWEQSAIARAFFERLDYTQMHNTNALIDAQDAYSFSKPGETYAVYLKHGGTTRLDLSDTEGSFSVGWYDPLAGGNLQSGSITTVTGGDWVSLGTPPSKPDADWALLVERLP
ncbi:MAG: hypothetical protein RhofKO_11520 [Rhodothermales bacterium]